MEISVKSGSCFYIGIGGAKGNSSRPDASDQTEHNPRRRTDPQNSPAPESTCAAPEEALRFLPQPRDVLGDNEPGNHEEQVDADAKRWHGQRPCGFELGAEDETGVGGDDREDRDPAQFIECGYPPVRGMRIWLHTGFASWRYIVYNIA